MRLYLQFGHGMLGHSKELLKAWGDGGVILSPRDLNVEQLKRAAKDARDAGVEALLDPQCYARASDHPKLCKHRYFELFTDSGTGALLQGTARNCKRRYTCCARRACWGDGHSSSHPTRNHGGPCRR